jgi:hypothetical protein
VRIAITWLLYIWAAEIIGLAVFFALDFRKARR